MSVAKIGAQQDFLDFGILQEAVHATQELRRTTRRISVPVGSRTLRLEDLIAVTHQPIRSSP